MLALLRCLLAAAVDLVVDELLARLERWEDPLPATQEQSSDCVSAKTHQKMTKS